MLLCRPKEQRILQPCIVARVFSGGGLLRKGFIPSVLSPPPQNKSPGPSQTHFHQQNSRALIHMRPSLPGRGGKAQSPSWPKADPES